MEKLTIDQAEDKQKTPEVVRLDDATVETQTKEYELLQGELHNSGKKGFRELDDKQKAARTAEIKRLATTLSNEFVTRYTELCEQFNIELRPEIQTTPNQPGIAQAVLGLDHMKKAQAKAEQQKPSDFFASRLKMRRTCNHTLNTFGDICERCGTAPANWGQNGYGVSVIHRKQLQDLIRQEKAKEAALEAETERDKTTQQPPQKSTP